MWASLQRKPGSTRQTAAEVEGIERGARQEGTSGQAMENCSEVNGRNVAVFHSQRRLGKEDFSGRHSRKT